MTYEQTIAYLFSRLPMFSHTGAVSAVKNDLHNTIELCRLLGNPQHDFKTIHVAGTNGKGSVSHMLAAILQTAGYKTGLYTSPHLKDFRERIKINGEMADKQFVIDFTKSIQSAIEKMEPSFFEVTVAMAFAYFSKQQVDVAVIETGMGGRLDSTNIITPALSVITNIGWDHMNILGNSLEQIAFEKAGIIKPGIPVVIGEALPETEPVFRKTAAEKKATLSVASEKRGVKSFSWNKSQLQVIITEENKPGQKEYDLDLAGIYQTKNLLTLLESCSILQQQGWKIDDETIHEALQKVKGLTGFHGRWELIHHAPDVVIDVAHNADGIKQMIKQLEMTPFDKLHIIIGMVKDKDVNKVLKLLPAEAFYYFTKARIPRALPENDLEQYANEAGLYGKPCSDVNTALKQAIENAGSDDLILICGSIFLAGEIDRKTLIP